MIEQIELEQHSPGLVELSAPRHPVCSEGLITALEAWMPTLIGCAS